MNMVDAGSPFELLSTTRIRIGMAVYDLPYPIKIRGYTPPGKEEEAVIADENPQYVLYNEESATDDGMDAVIFDEPRNHMNRFTIISELERAMRPLLERFKTSHTGTLRDFKLRHPMEIFTPVYPDSPQRAFIGVLS